MSFFKPLSCIRCRNITIKPIRQNTWVKCMMAVPVLIIIMVYLAAFHYEEFWPPLIWAVEYGVFCLLAYRLLLKDASISQLSLRALVLPLLHAVYLVVILWSLAFIAGSLPGGGLAFIVFLVAGIVGYIPAIPCLLLSHIMLKLGWIEKAAILPLNDYPLTPVSE